MREGIHPNYYQATVTCNCGNTFVTGSTKPEIHVEVCSKCHSFYTGQQKVARASKFKKRLMIIRNRLFGGWKYSELYEKSAVIDTMQMVLAFFFERKPRI